MSPVDTKIFDKTYNPILRRVRKQTLDRIQRATYFQIQLPVDLRVAAQIGLQIRDQVQEYVQENPNE